jgi:hypothetical protein
MKRPLKVTKEEMAQKLREMSASEENDAMRFVLRAVAAVIENDDESSQMTQSERAQVLFDAWDQLQASEDGQSSFEIAECDDSTLEDYLREMWTPLSAVEKRAHATHGWRDRAGLAVFSALDKARPHEDWTLESSTLVEKGVHAGFIKVAFSAKGFASVRAEVKLVGNLVYGVATVVDLRAKEKRGPSADIAILTPLPRLGSAFDTMEGLL